MTNLAKFLDFLRDKRLPLHLTEDEIDDLVGPDAEAFCADFLRVNQRLTEVAGIWLEVVLCPAHRFYPASYYVTAYRTGQKSLFSDARAPAAGPYWIADCLRS